MVVRPGKLTEWRFRVFKCLLFCWRVLCEVILATCVSLTSRGGALFIAGCFFLPLFWMTNFWLFWPYLRGKRQNATIEKCASPLAGDSPPSESRDCSVPHQSTLHCVGGHGHLTQARMVHQVAEPAW
jgi:hypothetical protein